MATERQIKANRENGKTGGVKSAEGKTVSRRNSLKHGLRADSILDMETDFDSPFGLKSLLQALRQTFQPKNDFEHQLIVRMAIAEYKWTRYEMLEATAFKEERWYKLALAMKYKGCIDAQYYRAYNTLMQSRNPQQLGSFVPKRDKK